MSASSPPSNSLPVEQSGSLAGYTRSRVLLHDSLIFLALCGIAVALFGVTWFLFRSFAEHRLELGRQWAAQGRADLQANQPLAAVEALRTSLSYMPDDRADQLLLAEALAAAGRTEEASNYFLLLWDQQPGDGFVNLQLARLERRRGDVPEAVNYYRAAITGNWEGDGTLRRRDARLELADYFSQRKEFSAARAELLVAAGNAPPDGSLQLSLGDRLEAVGDLPSALQLYQKALQADPHRWSALQKAGRLAYELGQYEQADKLLSAAAAEPTKDVAQERDDSALRMLAANARRIPQLSLSEDLPADVLADHIGVDAKISQRRLQACTVQLDPAAAPATTERPLRRAGEPKKAANGPLPGDLPPAIAALRDRGAAEATILKRGELARDAHLRSGVIQLIDDTESETAKLCGPPTGDDALLLMLSHRERPGSRP